MFPSASWGVVFHYPWYMLMAVVLNIYVTDCICTVHVVRSLNLLTPTHAQLNFIKNHLKNSYMFRSTTIFRELQYPR